MKKRPTVQVGMDILKPTFKSDFGTLAVSDTTCRRSMMGCSKGHLYLRLGVSKLSKSPVFAAF